MPRTRSASAHRKVLDAALDLVAARGVDGASMDAIAESSGVSKATLYKHWSDKEALLLELMAEIHGLHARPVFDSGDTRADIVAVLSYRPQEHSELRERITPHFMGYAARNPAFGDAWRDMVMEPPRRELRHLLKKGIARRELTPKLDMELSLSLLLGPIVYWYVFLRRKTADPTQLAEAVADSFWRAFAYTETRATRRNPRVTAGARRADRPS
jgi:AcrR family transcriptional regulator